MPSTQEKHISVNRTYKGSGLKAVKVDKDYSDYEILSYYIEGDSTGNYNFAGYCKLTDLNKTDLELKATYTNIDISDGWSETISIPSTGWCYQLFKQITEADGVIKIEAKDINSNYKNYKTAYYEKDGQYYVQLDSIFVYTNDYHLSIPSWKIEYDNNHPDADYSWDKYITNLTYSIAGARWIPITFVEDTPDTPDPLPTPSHFEYLVQNTHGYYSAKFSKDNYLQGLNSNGPNIWLNFDNAGTDDYGTYNTQDIQQKWTNDIFDYKTQTYFEHPMAGCTQPQPERAGHFAGCRISFRGMGPNTFYGEDCKFTKEDLDLLGFSINTKFNSIAWTYAFYFTPGTSDVTITKDNSNHVVQILVGTDGCDNGKILCQRIVKALCESSDIQDDTELKEVFAHPNVNPYHIDDPWTIGQDEIIFWNSEHFGVAEGFEPQTLKTSIKINAEYIGPIIFDNEHYDKKDVVVKLIYEIPGSTNTKIVELKQEEFTVDSTLVLKENAIGDLYCEFTVSHTEKLYGETTPTTFTDIIQVPILYIKEFKAEYIGPYIYIVSDYDVNDVIVSMTYNRPEYNKVLDKSEYDLSTTTIDKLGVNTIIVTEHSKGYTTTFIVIGVRVVLDINARYIGPPIEIMEKYDPLDVIVELDTVDINHQNRMTIILKYSPDIITMIPGVQGANDYLIQDPGLVIYSVGDNIRTVFYKDPLIEATTDFIVPGIPKLIDFETTYIGDTRIIGERIYKSEVLAIATWITEYDGIDCTLETRILEDNEWEFYDAPIITDMNKGFFRTKYESLFSSVKIKYDVPSTLRLRCWYEGAKIEVGNVYAYEDVAVFLVLPNNDLKRLRVSDLEFSSNFVTIEGWNYYTVTYKTDYYVLSGIFAVPGYIPIKYPDVDFMVRYIDIPNNYREIDCTEKFRPKFTFDGVFVISWKQFLAEVNELMLYGLYILTAPKCTGLSNKYDQDWEVLCINKTTLKANIMKTFLKEEDLPWQERNQQE